MTHTNHAEDEIIAVLDAGSQYGKVIDRKVRELQVATTLLPLETPAATLLADKRIKGVIISGGPNSVYAADAPKYDAALFESGLPILGICYGMQMANATFKGEVTTKTHREDGQLRIRVDTSCLLFEGLDAEQEVLLTHGDSVTKVADGFREVAWSGSVIAGIEHAAKRIYGVQFHPEVELSTRGRDMLRNFLFKCCGCTGTFRMADREQIAIEEIRTHVGDKKVLVLVSGGVDSTVCAALVSKAIGPERIHALHIDNGFMRRNESQLVEESLGPMRVNLRVVDASETFYNATTTVTERATGERRLTCTLKTATAPEEKRKIIGDTFMKVAEEAVAALGLRAEDVFLAQGTLRPDLIESASSMASAKADAIKTHHNDTELVRALRDQGRVIEPLKDYHKDEVRELGKSLGLLDELVMRQPFPGPGLAVRLLCAEALFSDEHRAGEEAMLEAVTNFEAAEAALREVIVHSLGDVDEAQLRGLGVRGTLLPVRSVGVQGDGRTYSYVAALSSRGGAGAGARPNWAQLFMLAKLIPKVCRKVNRVVYVFGDEVTQPVNDITITHCTPDVLETLRRADHVVNTLLFRHNLTIAISQVPVVLVPVHFDRPAGAGVPSTKHSVVIRTFITNDFMTGVPARPGAHIPEQVLDDMVRGILEDDAHISRVMYDLTSKPPGTTEWE